MMDACPDPDAWESLIHGDPGAQLAEALERHIEQCPSCRRILTDRANPGDVGWLDGFPDGNRAIDREPELESAMRQLKAGPTGRREEKPWDIRSILGPPTSPDSIGRFAGLDILGVIASGGMGVVLRAHDPALDRVVAVKILHPRLGRDRGFRDRFLREARAAAGLHHDHVIVVHAVGEENGVPYLVMQHFPAGSLQDRLSDSRPVPAGELARIGRQVAEALTVAHASGLIHRDVKPANILLETDPVRVRVADFGLVQSVASVAGDGREWLAGTPAFMAPEQAAGRPATTATDVYGLGATLCALATGQPPALADGIPGTLQQARSGTRQPMDAARPDLPRPLRQWIGRMLAPDPAERPSAREVADGLGRLERRLDSGRTGIPGVAAAVTLSVLIAGMALLRRPTEESSPAPVRFRPASSEVSYDTLAAAVEAGGQGESIEVSGTGVVPVDSLVLRDRPLRIRAVPGANPVLLGTNVLKPVIDSDSDLELEGLTLEHRIFQSDTPPLVRVTRAPLRLVSCRLLKSSLTARAPSRRVFCVEALDAPSLEVDRCELIAVERSVGAILFRVDDDRRPDSDIAGEVRVGRSLLAGLESVEIVGNATEPVALTLDRSVFINRVVLRVDADTEASGCRVRATGCFFDTEWLIFGTADPTGALRRNVAWDGRENRYSVRLGFISLPARGQPAPAPGTPATVAGWMDWLGGGEVGSRAVPLDLWGDLQGRGIHADELRARHLSLPGAEGITIGPEVLEIGPGEARMRGPSAGREAGE